MGNVCALSGNEKGSLGWLVAAICFVAGAALAGPQLVCDEPVFDFGERSAFEAVEHTFILRNTGDEVVKIGRVRPGCACTIVAPERNEIPAGEEELLKISLPLTGMRGIQRKSIMIESNDSSRKYLLLWLRGKVESDPWLVPASVSFGNIDPQVGTSMVVRVESRVAGVVVTNVVSDSAVFAIDDLTGDHSSYVVHYREGGEFGRQAAKLRIMTTHPRYPLMMQSVAAYCLPPVHVVPSRIAAVGLSDSNKRSLLLRPGSAARFTVTGVVAPEGVTSEIVPQSGGAFRIDLNGITPDLAGDEVTLFTNAIGMTNIVLTIE